MIYSIKMKIPNRLAFLMVTHKFFWLLDTLKVQRLEKDMENLTVFYSTMCQGCVTTHLRIRIC